MTISQKVVVVCKGSTREEPLRFDMLVEGCVMVEAKAAQELPPAPKAQSSSRMEMPNPHLGLRINFHKRNWRKVPTGYIEPALTNDRPDPKGHAPGTWEISPSPFPAVPVSSCAKARRVDRDTTLAGIGSSGNDTT